MLHSWGRLQKQDFRKKSSFSQILPVKKAMLRLSPTTMQSEMTLRVNDYGEKCA
jgi:hypothetical protein